jgi:hypothetical protein
MHGEASYRYPIVAPRGFCPGGSQALRVLRGGGEQGERIQARKSENDC